ncbi:Domain first found in C1r, C1s, uEGF, and bone morphogenetic protein [Desmophyllum pertusum]|uniref:Domain first found in C1r, C1s, uEGF, and bone morphogenetic protein n=1 Tax=Desmophyllum pertusum TaxID=174260 RepID=A0A9W9Z0D9_9CNID|nr:Domain first found in C1r, C1s, uEGF, and bone morphogenetic protein [Desmophyllum pertusum]
MPDVYSTGRYMRVTFYSGITSGRWGRPATGFKAHFEAVDPQLQRTFTPVVGTCGFISYQIRSGGHNDGFIATFTAEKKPTVPVPSVAAISKELCFPGNINNNDLELTGSHGTLQSPTEKHSGKYPPDSSCDWLITVPDGKIVKLSFDRFNLQPSTHDECTQIMCRF